MKFTLNVAAITWMMNDSRVYGFSTSLQCLLYSCVHFI